MKKGPFKMKGPGLKTSRDERINRMIKKGRKINSMPAHQKQIYYDKLERNVIDRARSADRVSTKPTSVSRKAKTAFDNVPKGFKNKAAKTIKKIASKSMKGVVRTGAALNRLNPLSAALGAAGAAVYKHGQKRTGGKIRKGQKTNTMGFGKKSIFKK